MTIDSIIEELKKHVESRQDLMPGFWVDKAAMLAVLSFDLNDELIGAEMAYNQFLDICRDACDSAAAAEIKAKASPQYEKMRKLKLKLDSCQEFMKLAKTRSYVE